MSFSVAARQLANYDGANREASIPCFVHSVPAAYSLIAMVPF
jgi:hypothetical protein